MPDCLSLACLAGSTHVPLLYSCAESFLVTSRWLGQTNLAAAGYFPRSEYNSQDRNFALPSRLTLDHFQSFCFGLYKFNSWSRSSGTARNRRPNRAGNGILHGAVRAARGRAWTARPLSRDRGKWFTLRSGFVFRDSEFAYPANA